PVNGSRPGPRRTIRRAATTAALLTEELAERVHAFAAGERAVEISLVVRMHRGAHSRRDSPAVKHHSSDQKRHATVAPNPSPPSSVNTCPPTAKRGVKNFSACTVQRSTPLV